ncbi:EboA domain-containing protein [Asanoa sp. NPDC049573]|uniref:EboA domain-containing protein n=1 Tax=Asanoa sp. NPDC049573 TaxID=3155396 RepID=UPI0034349F53
MTLDDLHAALARAVPPIGWVDEAVRQVRADPGAIARLFPRAARACGRAPLANGWTADEAARALLLAALPKDRVAEELERLYRYGDANEKRAVLRALPLLPIGNAGVPLLHDALRTNDTRLVGAALGPYAAHLDAATWRQGVLKCVFMGLPLSCVDGLDERADEELRVMLAGLAEERAAAGRPMAADATGLLNRLAGTALRKEA